MIEFTGNAPADTIYSQPMADPSRIQRQCSMFLVTYL